MSVEQKRRCGFRRVGGLYLVSQGSGRYCDRLPFELTVCPCCHAGIKQARGWTWVDTKLLFGGEHLIWNYNPDQQQPCPEADCPLCRGQIDRAGLLWVGEKFYPTPADFNQEADAMGISRRIPAVPRGFEAGKTWVLLAHPLASTCPDCKGAGLVNQQAGLDSKPCIKCENLGKVPGIFKAFKPERLEKIVTTSQSQDLGEMEALLKRGITVVVVPDGDADHKGKEEEFVTQTEQDSATMVI